MKEIVEEICLLCEKISEKHNKRKNIVYAFGMFYGIMKEIPEDSPRVYLEEQLQHWKNYLLNYNK